MMPPTWRGSRLKEVLVGDSPVDLKFVRWEGDLNGHIHPEPSLKPATEDHMQIWHKNVENG